MTNDRLDSAGRHARGGPKPTRRRRFDSVVFTTVAQYLSQIVTSALGVVLLKVLIIALGAAGYGQYATATNFVTIFSLFTDLGVAAMTPRQIARTPADEADILSYGLGFRIGLNLIVLPIMGIIGWLVYHGPDQYMVRLGILLAGPYLLGDAIRQMACSHYTAFGRSHRAAFLTVAQQLLLMTTAIIAALTHANVAVFLSLFSGSSIALATFTYVVVYREIQFVPKFSRTIWISTFLSSIGVGLIQVINVVYLRVDGLILSVIDGTTSAGVYSVAYLCISAFVTAPGFLMSSLIPRLATANREIVTATVQRALDVMITLGLLLLAAVFVNRYDFVALLSSGSYRASANPMIVLMVGMVFGYMTTVVTYSTISLGSSAKLPLVSALTLCINVGLNLILIPRYSIMGAAVATAVCDALMCLLVWRHFSSRIGISLKLGRAAIWGAVACALTIIAGQAVSSLSHPDAPLVRLLQNGTVCVLVFAATILLSGQWKRISSRIEPIAPTAPIESGDGGS